MRAVIRSVIVMIGIVTAVIADPASVRLSATRSLNDDFAVASVLPARGQLVGVAHPVVVTFRTPVANRRAAEHAVAVKSTPTMTGHFEWLQTDVVQWIPDRYWPAHTTVALSVGDHSTNFDTGAKLLGVADTANHTFTVSIDGKPADAPPRLPAPHHRPHYGEEGVLPASMGKPEFPTPVGRYAVMSKDPSVTMDSSSVGIPVTDPEGYRLKVNDAVRISSRGLYVHAAPWAVLSMGIENVSHGCISLAPADAEWYFNNVKVGDPVIVQ